MCLLRSTESTSSHIYHLISPPPIKYKLRWGIDKTLFIRPFVCPSKNAGRLFGKYVFAHFYYRETNVSFKFVHVASKASWCDHCKHLNMYVGLNVGLSYISDCQLFGMHCQRSSMLLLIIALVCHSLLYIYIYFFPLFHDQAKTLAMIRHSMDVVRKAVEIINHGQVSIITWSSHWDDHSQSAQWSSRRTRMDCRTGTSWYCLYWSSRLLLESVTCDLHLKCPTVQSLCSLYGLLKNAYVAYTSELTEDAIILSFNDWCSRTAKTCPSFHFWSIILQLEIDMLI